MRICPVDLAVCQRPECGGRHCELADHPHLTICWECVTCVTVALAANDERS
jgi:hypothetical protein